MNDFVDIFNGKKGYGCLLRRCFATPPPRARASGAYVSLLLWRPSLPRIRNSPGRV